MMLLLLLLLIFPKFVMSHCFITGGTGNACRYQDWDPTYCETFFSEVKEESKRDGTYRSEECSRGWMPVYAPNRFYESEFKELLVINAENSSYMGKVKNLVIIGNNITFCGLVLEGAMIFGNNNTALIHIFEEHHTINNKIVYNYSESSFTLT